MYRFFALALVFGAAACGGGSASPDPTATNPPATNTVATQEVAGARTQTPVSPTAAAADGKYTVVEGDTLGEIAVRFNTTVEALVAANGLANADELTIGQVLNVAGTAGGGTPTPGATAAATATPTQ